MRALKDRAKTARRLGGIFAISFGGSIGSVEQILYQDEEGYFLAKITVVNVGDKSKERRRHSRVTELYAKWWLKKNEKIRY